MADDTEETVQVDFSLSVGGGRVDASVEVPKRHTNLTQLLPVLQSLDNSVIEYSVRELEEGETISCRAGCGTCCRQMVPISIFEAEALTEWIRALPLSRQQALEQRFHQVLLGLRDAGMLERILAQDWIEDEMVKHEMGAEYFQLGLPCPFLEDESCSIHPIRPMSCREYLVTSPAALCSDPVRNQVAIVPLALRLSRALYRMGQELEADPRGWIPLVFLFAWMKSGAHPGEAFSGTGPEVLYEFVRRVATGETPALPPKEASAPLD